MIMFKATLALAVVLVVGQAAANRPHLDQELVKQLAKEYQEVHASKASKWLSYNDQVHIYLYRGGGDANPRMAAYGVEGTIAQTLTGSPFPQNAKDWRLMGDIKAELELASQATRAGPNQARLVLFENQYGVKLGHVSLQQVKERTEQIVKELYIPCTVLISVHKDRFRKPKTGMFELFEAAFNGAEQVDKSKSYYKGHESGADSFSDHDLKFAQNIGVEFRSA